MQKFKVIFHQRVFQFFISSKIHVWGNFFEKISHRKGLLVPLRSRSGKTLRFLKTLQVSQINSQRHKDPKLRTLINEQLLTKVGWLVVDIHHIDQHWIVLVYTTQGNSQRQIPALFSANGQSIARVTAGIHLVLLRG